jgi:uncharacterized protein YktB (UPF0637 family)
MDETNNIIKECKKIIENENLQKLKEYYNTLDKHEIFISNTIPYEYIFQKLFIHACNYGNKEIIEWLIEKYYEMDNIRKIALRQLFFYGKYILKKNKKYKEDNEIIKWYDNILDKIRLEK